MLLIVSMASFGCGKTQEEKFKETATKIANSCEVLEPFEDKVDKNPNDKIAKENLKKAVLQFEKDTKIYLAELDLIAKGNEKLEKKATNYRSLIKNTYEGILEKTR